MKADYFTTAVRTGGDGMSGVSLLLMEKVCLSVFGVCAVLGFPGCSWRVLGFADAVVATTACLWACTERSRCHCAPHEDARLAGLLSLRTPFSEAQAVLGVFAGWWISNTAYVVFENVKVPVKNLIGKENDGYATAESSAVSIRLSVTSAFCSSFKSIMYNFNHERFVLGGAFRHSFHSVSMPLAETC
jgi:hypothetical protein